jgi:hypothetical protein
VSFDRLLRADAVAMLAAFALLFVMAMDWYGTTTGDDARRIEKLSQPSGAEGGQLERDRQEGAREVAEGAEKNAWQVKAFADRLVLMGLLATVILAVAAAYLRAAGRRFEPPATPSTAAAVAATVTALGVLYRIIQEPGFDDSTTVKMGAPLALVLLAVIALACRDAMRQEDAGTAWKALAEDTGPAGQPGAAG